MYLYSITINIDDDVHDEWLVWMKDVFIPEIFSSNLVVNKNFLRMINDEKSGGTTYSLQLFLKSMDDYEEYEKKFSDAHQMMLYSRYNNKFVEFRTLLKLVD